MKKKYTCHEGCPVVSAHIHLKGKDGVIRATSQLLKKKEVKEELKIEVLRIGGEWKVEFGFGNQSFVLEYGGTKAEANWMAKMLRICFKNYKESITYSTPKVSKKCKKKIK